MISINLDDPNVVENFKALNELRHTGLFSDDDNLFCGHCSARMDGGINE